LNGVVQVGGPKANRTWTINEAVSKDRRTAQSRESNAQGEQESWPPPSKRHRQHHGTAFLEMEAARKETRSKILNLLFTLGQHISRKYSTAI
jgi:hypothetical protein